MGFSLLFCCWRQGGGDSGEGGFGPYMHACPPPKQSARHTDSSFFFLHTQTPRSPQVTLPLNAGTVQLHGLACPANPGPINYGLEVRILSCVRVCDSCFNN